ncbi:NADPH-dependent F420 reductase [Streptosporangium sp. G11]|uniref:NADPH-dependent F420 reductase n=1 Tax=Streptosporangium sp. G11 TaxID=3436926 RepID=UPI003EBD436B
MSALSPRGTQIAILGAGRVGSALGRVMVDAGYEVSVAASGDPAELELIASIVMPGVTPRWDAEAAAEAELVVLAIPLHRFATFDPALVAGKIVIDNMNYWAPTDGVQTLFEDTALSSSEIVQRHLPASTVVKTFNHIGYHELEEDRRPVGAHDRRALGVAGDDPAAVELVAAIVDRLGYDPVTLDTLRAGRAFQPGGPVFGARLDHHDFERAVRARATA